MAEVFGAGGCDGVAKALWFLLLAYLQLGSWEKSTYSSPRRPDTIEHIRT